MNATNPDIKHKNLNVKTRPVSFRYSLFERNGRMWMSLVLFLTDTFSLLLSLLIAVNLRPGGEVRLFDQFYVSYLWTPVLLLMVIYLGNGLYPGIGISAVEEVRRITTSTTLLFLILVTLTFLLKTSEIYSRIIFFLAWAMALCLLPLSRILIRRMCVRFKIWGEPVGIVGFPDRRLAEVADFFLKYPHKGMNPRAIFMQEPIQGSLKKPYRILAVEEIEKAAKRLGIQTVLVVVPNWNWVGENLDKYRYSFRRVILIRQQRDSFSLSDSVALDFNGVMGFQVNHNLLSPWSMLLKRVIDILASGFLIVVLAPLIAVISLLIRTSSPGRIYYTQSRLGRGGKVFQVLKFRSMYTNADEVFEARLKEDKALREEWKKYQKIKHDPRITPIGEFLRKTSLDELPQLRNIFTGEMSLVGPRPIMLNQQEMYGPGLHDYIQVRPGVTGLWQVSGRNRTTFARRAELDMEYIQRWSVWLDVYIIFQTFKEVISRDGAY